MILSKFAIDRFLAIATLVLIVGVTVITKNKFGIDLTIQMFIGLLILNIGNLVFRNFTWSKPWLLSRFNIFSSKYHQKLRIKLSKEIAFAKFLEVLQSTNFQVVKVDNKNLEIFARAEFNFPSGGENLYLSFTGEGRESQLSFYSASPRIYDFYKNHENYQKVMNAFDDALTI